MQPARRARVRLAVFVTLAALTVASTGMTWPPIAPASSPPGALRGTGAPTMRSGSSSRSGTTPPLRRARVRALGHLPRDVRARARRAVYQTTQTALRSEKRRLERDPSVRTVQVSHRLYRALDPEDEQFWDALWGLHNTGQTILVRGRGECRRRRPGIARGRRRNRGRRRGHRRWVDFSRPTSPARPGSTRGVGRRQGDQQRRRRCERLHRRRQRLGLLPRRQDRPRPRRRLPRDARLGTIAAKLDGRASSASRRA